MIDENNNAFLGNKAKKTKKSGKGKTIEQIYQKKTQLEHILLRPDTYVGSVEKVTQPMYVYDAQKERIVQRTITYVPGLYKIFDEIIVNAADNKQRDPSMDRIEVNIDQDSNTISVFNNGHGIPVVIHKEQNIYVPELIFGHLLTGSNFDDDQKKTTGGRNGYGAKLANIFSQEFIVETADKNSGKRFKQVFRNNMTIRDQPILTNFTSGSEFTSITFRPDLNRFKMERLDDDTVALLCKRAFDVAGGGIAHSGKRLRVVLNGKRLPISSFQQYLELYEGVAPPVVFEKLNDRWEVGIGISDGQMQQISFVNSICTSKGGQHVNYIADQVAQKLAGIVKKKNKGQEVKPHMIKNHLAIFVNVLIENPAFDSQTKETLTTRSSAFGSTCKLPDPFLKKIEKSSVVESILSFARFKQNEQLKRKGGKKSIKLTGIPKLDDANFAGTARGHECTLVLTEGDSAKALAVSGISVVGRDYYGVFPLKGKPLNVRDAAHNQIMKNEEVQNIVKILGLKFGTTYTNTKSLRYGHLMIMTDQDHDGSHIKGLLINLLHHFFPSLLEIPGFLQQFITPIVKCTKAKKTEVFFTLPEYEQWKFNHNDGKGWSIKYYKGLGTSSSKEAKEYFSDLATHQLKFSWQDAAVDGDLIDMAFSKKRVEDRKDWLRDFEQGTYVDYGVDSMTYENFVNKELILFSIADCMRSIPHIFDGFKPSQRKVLFACFKRKLKNEIKVAQLAGYVSEHAAYHHGEASLNSTIVGMAQNFVGSNNINLLFPSGQFGTRLMGGKDAASPRYIFTRLEPIARMIFHPDDDPLLNFLDDDGQTIEPEYYLPVIPMVLVNGSDGIGTGWSSFIPNYNPRDIIKNLRRKIQEETMFEMHPWYNDFGGEISIHPKNAGSYMVKGRLDVVDESTIVISELPIRKWTQDYKVFLESLLPGASGGTADGIIKGFKENHTDTTVLFTITMDENVLNRIRIEPGGLCKKFKIDSSISTSNMTLFSESGIIEKHRSALAIMDIFYEKRFQGYVDRKEYLVDKLNREFRKLDNKVRFILAVVEERLVVNNRKRKDLLEELQREGYELFDGNESMEPNSEDDSQEGEDEDDSVDIARLARGYDYLLSMKIWNLTMEKVNKLRAEREAKKAELRELEATPSWQLWLNDLDAIEAALDDLDVEVQKMKEVERKQMKAANKKGPAKKSKKNKRAAKKKKAWMGDSSEDISEFDDSEDSDFEFGAAKNKKNAKPKQNPQLKDVSRSGSTSWNGSATMEIDKAIPDPDPPVTSKSKSSGKSSSGKSSQSKQTKARKTTSKKEKSKPEPATNELETIDILDDSPVEEFGSMSLADRMRARMQSGQTNLQPSKETSKRKTKKNHSQEDSEDDLFVCSQTMSQMTIEQNTKKSDSETEDESQPEPSGSNAMKKGKATKQKESNSQQNPLYGSFDFSGSEEEASFERKTTKKTQKKATSNPKATKGTSKASTKTKTTQKRSKKSKDGPTKEDTDSSHKDMAIFSPGFTSPEQTKKRRTIPQETESLIEEGSEEENTAATFDMPMEIKKTPKPSRTRQKPVYYVDSEISEEEESEAEWNDDEDDSEFEF